MSIPSGASSLSKTETDLALNREALGLIISERETSERDRPVSWIPTARPTAMSRLVPAPTRTPTPTWEEWVSGILGIATDTATTTTRLRPPVSGITSESLERLIQRKPGPWGHKGFYLSLGLLYVGLLGALAKVVVTLLRGNQKD